MLEAPLYKALLGTLVLEAGGKSEESIGDGLRNACRAVSIKVRYWADKTG